MIHSYAYIGLCLSLMPDAENLLALEQDGVLPSGAALYSADQHRQRLVLNLSYTFDLTPIRQDDAVRDLTGSGVPVEHHADIENPALPTRWAERHRSLVIRWSPSTDIVSYRQASFADQTGAAYRVEYFYGFKSWEDRVRGCLNTDRWTLALPPPNGICPAEKRLCELLDRI